MQTNFRRRAVLSLLLALLFITRARDGVAVVCPAEANRDAIAFFYRSNPTDTYCDAVVESTVVEVLRGRGYELDDLFEDAAPDPDNGIPPVITLSHLRTAINGMGVAYLSTHGFGSHPEIVYGNDTIPASPGGDPGVETYKNFSDAQLAAINYIASQGYRVTDFIIAEVDANTSFIFLNRNPVTDYLNTMAQNSLLYFESSWSTFMAGNWNSAAALIGYDYSPTWSLGCPETQEIWRRLACLTGSYPDVGHAVSGLTVQTGANSNLDVALRCDIGCRNEATFYVNPAATTDSASGDVLVSFQTDGESGSLSHTLRGFPSFTAYPDTAETLAVLSAMGAPNIVCGYSEVVEGGYAVYDIVEEGADGSRTGSGALIVNKEPALAVSDTCVAREPTIDEASGQAYWYRHGAFSLYEPGKRDWGKPGTPAGALTTECTDCADYLVYVHHTSTATADTILAMVVDSLESQGLDAAGLRVPWNNLSWVRAPLSALRATNAAWNASAGDSLRLYPVDPGPTLLIIGDAQPPLMPPIAFPNNGQCGVNLCHSYLLAGDLNNDSIPDCPVEVVPASDLAEAHRAIVAAVDFNRGFFIDDDRNGLFIGNDGVNGWEGSPWVMDYISDTAVLARVHGIESDLLYVTSPYEPTDSLFRVDVRTRINAGVIEGWMIGGITGYRWWPGYCISSFPPIGVEALTTKQRMTIWAPGCHMGYVGAVGTIEPIVEQIQFNDINRTMMAGGVFHYDNGYEIKHLPWAEILRDARFSAMPGTSISRIHYDAVQAWFDQFPGDTYVLSSVAFGPYVIPPDVATGLEPPSRSENASGLTALGNVGEKPTFVFSLASQVSVSLRVFDVSGREVTIVREASLPAGRHQFTWFGKDRTGRTVAPGVYFGVLMTSEGRRDAAKVVIVR
ncbi:MAG: FlgD immunoglobulin-like domain containing protein [bacterium]